MNYQNIMEAATMILPGELEGHRNGDKSSTAKRKPVRRDLEKRRQQNIQAQKKYREYSLIPLHRLESTASTLEDNHF